MAPAAYNLCVLEAETSPAGALEWCRQAVASRPREPRYAFTLAFYQLQAGQTDSAIAVLRKLAATSPDYIDGQMLLAQLLESRGETQAVVTVYQKILRSGTLSPSDRRAVQLRLAALSPHP